MDQTRQHPLRVIREQYNLSLEALATATGLSKRTILRAEQGYGLHPASRRILCDYFAASPQDLGLLPSANGAEVEIGEQPGQRALVYQVALAFSGNSGEQRNHLDLFLQPGLLREVEKYMGQNPSRRVLLQQLLGLLSLTLPTFPSDRSLSPEAGERLSRALTEPAAIDDATIVHYEQLTSLCWRLSDEDGLGLIEQILPEHVPQVTQLATQKGKYQARLASIAAQSYLLGYVLALHKEDFQQALACCQQARLYGQLSGDPNLETVALLRQGNVYLYLRSPWKTLTSYQEALPQIATVSPLVRTRMYAVMAEIQGKLGQEEDVRASMGAAYASFPTSMKDDPAAQYIHFSKSGLYLHEGLAFLNLHQGQLAARALEQVDGLQPKLPISERSRIDILIQQSWAASQVRDLDQFSVYLDAAVTSARKLSSDLMLSEAWDCYNRQGYWAGEPKFKRLGDLFRQS